LFIVWQLFFLVASNFLGMLRKVREHLKDQALVEALVPGWTRGQGHFYDGVEVLAGLAERWAQLTCQTQNWSLFAPELGTDLAFLAVEVCWDEVPLSAPHLARLLAPLAAGYGLESASLWAGSRFAEASPVPSRELLLSDNEPEDLRRYLRLGRFRLRRYEGNLDLILSVRPDKTPAEETDRWRQRIEDKVSSEWRCLQAYLQWRWRAYQRSHPGAPPPRQLIVHVRQYRIPPPDQRPWSWHGPEQRPLARWQPDVKWAAGYLPLEMYNPVTGHFERLKVKDQDGHD
jgi:hypothetical protein